MRISKLYPTLLALSLAAACTGVGSAPNAESTGVMIKEDAQAIAASYSDWGGPVDFQLRFGPALCSIPPIEPRFSESAAPGAHAEKLYLVHASDATSYAGVDYSSETEGGALMPASFETATDLAQREAELPELSQDWQQILVKEAFVPTLADENAERSSRHDLVEFTPAARDGESWMPGDPAGLFLMLRTARATPGTDEGWVYATVRANGDVSAYGQIPSCVACHRNAGPNRMFGLPGIEHTPTVKD